MICSTPRCGPAGGGQRRDLDRLEASSDTEGVFPPHALPASPNVLGNCVTIMVHQALRFQPIVREHSPCLLITNIDFHEASFKAPRVRVYTDSEFLGHSWHELPPELVSLPECLEKDYSCFCRRRFSVGRPE